MTSATLLLWRARVRSSLWRIVALALLTALGGGIALAVAAGARRTAGAHDRMLQLSDAAELSSSYVPTDPDETGRLAEQIPAIGDFTQLVGFATVLPDTPLAGLNSFAYYNDPVVVDRPAGLEGRLPEAANEVFLNEAAAAGAGAALGEELEVVIANPELTEFLPETMVVVGIGILPAEIFQDETEVQPFVAYGREFVESHRGLIVWGNVTVKVAPGFTRADAMAQMTERGLLIDNDRAPERAKARAAIRPLAVTLNVLALLAGLATVVVVGQALRRLVQRSPAEARSLAATGCGRGTLMAADVGVAVIVGVAGTIGAVGVAILASPLFPQGRTRRVPALRGIDVDLAVLGIGALAMLLALAAIVAASSRRRIRGEAHPGSAPGVLGSNPAVATGVRFATGRHGLPGTVGGVAVGLMSIVTAVTFTGSMDRLVSRPELAGFNWDLMGTNGFGMIDTAAVVEQLRDDPDVERITGLTFADSTIDGTQVPATAWAAIKGSPWPPITAGRTPEGPNEILVGPGTLDTLGRQIGDAVTVAFSGDPTAGTPAVPIDMTVVGTAVSPAIGLPGTDTPRLGDGVLVRQADVANLGFEADLGVEYGGAMLFGFRDGADTGLVRTRFPEGLPDDSGGTTEWFESAQPAEVIQTGAAVDVLELAIVALLIGVMATVGHNLLGFVRERRNAFAVLKALGFTPRQIRSTVLWQSGLVVGAGLVVAVPLGIAAGRWLYQGFAGGIGVIVQPIVPWPALTFAVLAAVALVQVVALVPARQARRTDAATELRWE